MYLSARQFPHLKGKSDEEIRELMRRGMERRPGLTRLLRAARGLVLAGMAVSIALIEWLAKPRMGFSLLVSGAGATLLLLVINFVWLNWGLFPLTKEEAARGKKR
jgi:hypothetical protein